MVRMTPCKWKTLRTTAKLRRFAVRLGGGGHGSLCPSPFHNSRVGCRPGAVCAGPAARALFPLSRSSHRPRPRRRVRVVKIDCRKRRRIGPLLWAAQAAVRPDYRGSRSPEPSSSQFATLVLTYVSASEARAASD